MAVTIDRAAAMSHARRLWRDNRDDLGRILALIRSVPAPTLTYDEALALLVERDVQRWGEAEREASAQIHRENHPTLGLILNSVAHMDLDAPDETLEAQALLVMTATDVAALMRGC